jgi:Abortive infection alpha
MARKKSTPQLGISAKATANIGATATYSVKKEIKETVPADVSRAKAAAWLSLISPLTEWAGLKADQLNYKRALLRLQREETLTRIAQKIRKFSLSSEKRDLIPTKFIVEYLEKASLESPDDPLVDLWANLLVSAASDYGSHHLHFVNIINQLDAKQAKLFSSLIGTKKRRDLELAHDNIGMYFTQQDIQSTIVSTFDKKDIWDEDEICDEVIDMLDILGSEAIHSSVEMKDETKTYFDINLRSNYEDENEIDYKILESLRLIELVKIPFTPIKNFEITLQYYQ